MYIEICAGYPADI
jgi:integrase